MNFKDKSVLVYDNSGFFTGFCSSLVGRFSRVGYFYPWESFYSDGRELVVGQGLAGIERVKFFDDDTKQWDLIVFTGSQDGHLQADLRRQGYRVFGSGLGGETELLRWKTKERFKAAGIPLPECHRAAGIDELRAFFKENPSYEPWFVKVSELRGLSDTWSARNYTEAKVPIDEWECKYAPQCYLMHFILEKCIPDATELGYDGLSIDGQFPSQCMYGAEIKNKAYFGSVSEYKSLPGELVRVNEALEPALRELQYRNFFASELRNESPIDITARFSSPAGEVVTSNIENIDQVLWFGAEGTLIEPEWKHKYGAQLALTEALAFEKHTYLSFPEEIRPFLHLYTHCRVHCGELGLQDCIVPQFNPHYDRMPEIGSVVALADDPQEAINLCKERAEQVKGFKVTCCPEELDKALEEMNASSPA